MFLELKIREEIFAKSIAIFLASRDSLVTRYVTFFASVASQYLTSFKLLKLPHNNNNNIINNTSKGSPPH